MKKILAVLSVLGVATMLSGCSAEMKTDNFVKNIQDFKESINSCTIDNEIKTTQMKVGNYMLSTTLPNELKTNDIVNSTNETQKTMNNSTKQAKDTTSANKTEIANNNSTESTSTDNATAQISPTNEQNQPQTLELKQNEPIIKVEDIVEKKAEVDTLGEKIETEKNADINEQVSTLYSLSADIDDCCENFVTLKQNLTNAIAETQNLISKVNNKEIELNNEQKLLIAEQSKQLKDLGRKLASVTTELNFSLSDLNDLMLKNGDLNNLSLKYLIVLDNLINGNEMLENGLYSLNLINSMFNANAQLPPNNVGRILYGFRRNNEEPVVKDYLIDKDGKIVENTENQQNSNETQSEENKNTTIDTMQNNKLNANIDTYHNTNRNVDTFFNTALLDNEFMYGNGAGMMGNGLMYGYGNMNGNNLYNQNYNNTNYGVINEQNAQENDNASTTQHTKNENVKKRKWFNISKNVDTYKSENTPKLSARLAKIKNSITGFLGKFSKKD